MIEIEINPISIIREAREFKESFTLSSSEMDYIVSHPSLSSTEKLIWLMIAKHTAKDPHLSTSFTCQHIAKMVATKTATVLPSLYTLEAMGFLKINIDAGQIVDCSLTLPLAGLSRHSPSLATLIRYANAIGYDLNFSLKPHKHVGD